MPVTIGDILTLAQIPLSVAGLIAIAKFLFDWFSNYASKQKDLRQLDSEVRAAQKELIEGQKALREMDKELQNRQLKLLQEQLQNAGRQLESRSLTILQQTRRNALVDAGIRYLRAVWKSEGPGIVADVNSSFSGASDRLMSSDPHQLTALHMQFRGGLARRSPPEDPVLQSAYWAGFDQSTISHLRTVLEVVTFAIPFLVGQFDKNPDQPLGQILESYSDAIRAQAAQHLAQADALHSQADQIKGLIARSERLSEVVSQVLRLEPGSPQAQALLSEADTLWAAFLDEQKQLSSHQEVQDLVSTTEALLVHAHEAQRQPPKTQASESQVG